MPTWEKKREFPAWSKANPGRKAVRQGHEKQKLVQSPSRGPLRRKSKSKGEKHR